MKSSPRKGKRGKIEKQRQKDDKDSISRRVNDSGVEDRVFIGRGFWQIFCFSFSAYARKRASDSVITGKGRGKGSRETKNKREKQKERSV